MADYHKSLKYRRLPKEKYMPRRPKSLKSDRLPKKKYMPGNDMRHRQYEAGGKWRAYVKSGE